MRNKRILSAFVLGCATSCLVLLSISAIGKTYLSATIFPLIKKKDFIIAYDPRAKIPFLAYENLTSDQLIRGDIPEQRPHFFEERSIYPLHRSQNTDYLHSSFDKGHLVPAEDLRRDKDAYSDSFSLVNACPQYPSVNRGIWSQLERYIRTQTEEYDSIEVITGPLFLPRTSENGERYITYPVIGENCVAVPSHLFKVIKLNTRGDYCLKAYVIPNDDSEKIDLSSYEWEIPLLEKYSGFIFGKDLFRLLEKF